MAPRNKVKILNKEDLHNLIYVRNNSKRRNLYLDNNNELIAKSESDIINNIRPFKYEGIHLKRHFDLIKEEDMNDRDLE